MTIRKDLYRRILACYPHAPPEQGGILGMKDGIVCEYVHDQSPVRTDRSIYVPDIVFLNDCMRKWSARGISFCGIVHSHPHDQDTLSSGDLQYIAQLYQLNPWLDETYYPLVMDGRNMIVYKAWKDHNELQTNEEPLLFFHSSRYTD